MADFNAAVTRASGFFLIFTYAIFTCCIMCVCMCVCVHLFVLCLTTQLKFHFKCHASPNVLAAICVVFTVTYFLEVVDLKSGYILISLEIINSI